MTKSTLIALVACLLPVAAFAQSPIVNPSTATWVAPTTNTDATPLTDLSGYNVRATGPVSGACPSYTASAYSVRKTIASSSSTPPPNTTVTLGTSGSGNLAGDLGITADGQYCITVTAVDLALNESGAAAPIPFVRNRVAPGAPSGLQLNP